MFRFKYTKAFKSICLLLASSILLISCHTTQYVSLRDDYNAQIVGKSHADVVSLLGPPSRTASDGNGGEILIYEVKSQQGNVGGGSINLMENKQQTSVYLNEDKVCYKVETDDVKPVKVFSKGRTFGLAAIIAVGIILIATSAE